LFSVPPATEMFYFTGYASQPYGRDNTTLLVLSFLIRKSPDQRLLATSPKLIAGTPRPSSHQYPKASAIRL